MTIYIIPEETLQSFTHPALDLQTGQLIELEAEPVPIQLDLFTEPSRSANAPFRAVAPAHVLAVLSEYP